MNSMENTKWFSQTILTFKDRIYGTDGFLRLSINTNTIDYSQFNPPTINITITNNFQKTCSWSLSEISDLLKSFELLVKQQDANGSEIYKKYKDIEFYFKCFIEEKTQERLILMQLKSSESDFTRVIIPLQIFLTFKYLLNNFKNEYFGICKELMFQTIQSESQRIIQSLPGLIKGISTQIVSNSIQSQDIILDNCAPEIDQSVVSATEITIDALDKFLGDDMKNIKISELEEIKEDVKSSIEIKSNFVENILMFNLYNLENMFSSFMLDKKPIEMFKNDVIKRIRSNNDFTMLSDISDDDKKSLYYITKLFFAGVYEEHLENNKSLPETIPIFKYNLTKMDDENIQIAYDLFLFNIYIRTLRRRLEGKSTDVNLNKSLFHLQLRCFTDVFVFPYLDKLNHNSNTLSSIILNRYKYYNTKGVFDKYKVILKDYNCTDVSEVDVSSAVNEAVEKIIGSKTMVIKEIHDKLYNLKWTKIPSKCELDLEQILNECLPLEIVEKMGKDLNDEIVIRKLKEKFKISDDIIKYMLKNKPKVINEKQEKISNIQRICKFFENEIPKEDKDKFLDELKNYTDKKFDMKTTTFDLTMYGENIVKILYLWDPSNSVIKTNYKEFYMMVENEIMTKDLIITKIKMDVEVKEDETINNDWNYI